MNWKALITILLEFFGPFVRQWLEDLFDRVQPGTFPTAPNGTATAVKQLFAAARRETSWWQVRRRAVLAACESVAVARAGELLLALTDRGVPVLTRGEQEYIASVM